MFQENENNFDRGTSMSAVLQVCLQFMKSKVMTGEGDKLSFILYGCSQANNKASSEHISVLRRLDLLDAHFIREFETGIETFEENYRAPSARASFADTLMICH